MDNALSAKNVRVHGMSSIKWTTRDKIIQFKGLVNLYKRDRAICEADAAAVGKNAQKNLLDVRKTIENKRTELDNVISGDKQTIRNILADHKAMQLAFRNTESINVIERISQLNFTKRKVLDKLKYQIKLKSQELIDFKLEESNLEDRLRYTVYNPLPDERKAQIIGGKVQDALLKKEGALAILQSYVRIIDVMKKDALYFDGILLTIQNDYYFQCRCVLNAAKQGQLAMEYKDDRAREFLMLEESVLNDMRMQKKNLIELKEMVEQTEENVRNVLRRDSDLTLCVKKAEDTLAMNDLQKDLNKIETSLEAVSNAMLVSKFQDIYPTLVGQAKQRDRLMQLAQKCERDHDIIMNKVDHARTMKLMVENSMVETTNDYKKRKAELLELIDAENNNLKEYDGIISALNLQLAVAGMGVRQLQQMVKFAGQSTSPSGSVVGYRRGFSDATPPEVEEVDSLKIIEKLTEVLQHEMSKYNQIKWPADDPGGAHKHEAYGMYEHMMIGKCIPLEEEKLGREGVLGEFEMEGTSVQTREDIKKQSKEIVDAHLKTDIE